MSNRGNESCSLATPLLYDFTCYRWISWYDLPAKNRSRALSYHGFGHSASKLGDNRLLVMGGVRGSWHNDLEAVQLPADVSSYESLPKCNESTTQSECRLALQCIWCEVSLNHIANSYPAAQHRCVPTANADSVCYKTSAFHQPVCRDICSFQSSCVDCLKWRTGVEEGSDSFCSFCPSRDFTPSCHRAALPRQPCASQICDAQDEDTDTTSGMRITFTDQSGHIDTVSSSSTHITFRNPKTGQLSREFTALRTIKVNEPTLSCQRIAGQIGNCTGSTAVQVSVTGAMAWLSASLNSERPVGCLFDTGYIIVIVHLAYVEPSLCSSYSPWNFNFRPNFPFWKWSKSKTSK